MASRLNEELMKTNLDIPEGEIKIDGVANPVYADAINVHNKKKKEREKILKDKKDELKKPFLGTKGNTTVMPKTKDMKKLKLSEDLFGGVMDRKSWELKDKKNNKDTWSDIYNELVDMKDLETPHRQLKKSPKQRYSGGWDEEGVRVAPSRTDDAIVVYADEESQLDHAKEVADTYGVEFTVREHTSRYAEARFELKIYPSRPVMSESLVESVDSDVYSATAKYFDYGASAEFTETIADLVDRALMNKEEGYDTEEAVHDAIDSGLIYHKDIWTVKAGYEDSTLNDETYESLFHDIYSIVDSMSSEELEESLKPEYVKALKDKVNFCYSKEDLEEQGADLTDMSDKDIQRVLDGKATDEDIEKMFGGYSFVPGDFGMEESLKEDKNGKFVGQFNRVQTDNEVDEFVNLIEEVAKANGFDTTGLTVDRSSNVPNDSMFGVGTALKVTIPVQGKDKPFRSTNKDLVSGLTNIVFTCVAEKGYSDYDNHLDQLNVNKGMDKEDFDAEQFTIRATTNGTVKPYRKRYTHRLEGSGHYMYNGVISDFRNDLDSYFRGLKSYLGI